MKLEKLVEAKKLIDNLEKDMEYERPIALETFRNVRDELENILTEAYDAKEFLGQDEIIELLEGYIEDLNEIISFSQTDEQNATYGI